MNVTRLTNRVRNCALLPNLLTLALLLPGCADNEGYEWIPVTPADQLDKGPRHFSIETLHPTWSDVWCDAGGKNCVVVGEKGNIMHSKDGCRTWTAVSSGTEDWLKTIHRAGERLVAVGGMGGIVRSENGGRTWKAVRPPNMYGGGDLPYVVHSNGDRLVALAATDGIMLSDDHGDTWTDGSMRGDAPFHALYGEGERLVAVGYEGAIARSDNVGRTWSRVPSPTHDSLNAIHKIGKELVAVGDSGTIVRSDNDGKDWTQVPSPTEDRLTAIHGIGKELVAVGDRGTIVRLDEDGKTWIQAISYTEAALKAIHGVGKELTAIGEGGTIVHSSDVGRTWAPVPSGSKAELEAIRVVGDHTMVAIGQKGLILRSENDGKMWETVSGTGTESPLLAIHGDGQRMIAVGGYTGSWLDAPNEAVILRSEDGGKTWTKVFSGSDDIGFADIYGVGEDWVAIHGSGDAILRSNHSGDTDTWNTVSSIPQKRLVALHNVGDQLVAVGVEGTIVHSDNFRKTWELAESSGTHSDLRAIHGDDERWVAVGHHGAIVHSKDGGRHWTEASSHTDDTLRAVQGVGNQWVAVGGDATDGVIVRSDNEGTTWKKPSIRSGEILSAIYGNGELWVAVGRSSKPNEPGRPGVIVRSEDGGESWTTSGTQHELGAIHGDGRSLVAVGSNGTIVRSEDAGKTWTELSSGNGAYLRAIHGYSEGLVAVGNQGAIVVMRTTDLHWPVLKGVGYRSEPSVSGALSIRFDIHDPDGLCGENKGCTLEAWVRNETDFLKNRPMYLIQVKRTEKGWEAEVNPKDFSVQSGDNLHLEVLLKEPDYSLRYPIADSSITKPTIAIPYQVDPRLVYFVYFSVAIGSVATLLALLYWLKPLWLLSLYRRLGIFEAAQRLAIPGLGDGLQMLLQATVLPWLITRPRVLDFWVGRTLVDWKALFEEEEAVARLHYYPLPLRRAETRETIRTPGPEDFVPDISAHHALLQIIGAGGSGKTSLAAQLGRWALERRLMNNVIVPVWLDEDVADVRQWLVRRVREVARDDDLPESFIHALFKAKRLLLIVDRLSERQVGSREAMRHLPAWLAALVVTSRYQIDLGLPEVKRIEPQGLDSSTVMGFLETLIRTADGGSQLSGLGPKAELVKRFAEVITVGGKENRITPLLVSLFVKEALAQLAVRGNVLDALPTSIPAVYFEYLHSVNPSDESAKNYLPKEKMLLAARILACAELGEDFRPKRIDWQEAEKVLMQENLFASGTNPLQRLIDNQVLEQRREGGDYLVAFALDPVAEYLAAFAHAKRCGKNPDVWRELIEKVAALGPQAGGFMVALGITHQVYADEFGWPQTAPFPASPAGD